MVATLLPEISTERNLSCAEVILAANEEVRFRALLGRFVPCAVKELQLDYFNKKSEEYNLEGGLLEQRRRQCARRLTEVIRVQA